MRSFERIVLLLLALLLTLSLPLSLAGCGQKEPADGQEEQANDDTPALPEGDRIGAVPLGQCVIVYTSSATVAETRVAAMLKKQLATVKGLEVTACKSTAEAAKNAAGKIVIGRSLCQKAKPEGTHGFTITGNGNTLEIAANSSYGYQKALDYLTGRVIAKNRKVEIDDDFAVEGQGDNLLTAAQTKSGEVRFMVNNVYGFGEDNGKEQRMKMLLDLYKTYAPDVLGLQEFHAKPRNLLSPLLAQAGYTEVRFENEDGATVNGESTPLFYRADLLDLLDCGHLLYTAAPDLNAAAYQSMLGSYTMDEIKASDYSKSITWGIFRVKATGHVFMAASTHLFYLRNTDVTTDERDEIWRRVQVAVAKETLLAAADAYLTRAGLETGTMPILLGGDMNTTTNGSAYTSLTGGTPSSSGLYTGKNGMTNTNQLAPEGSRIVYSTNHHHEGNWNAEYKVYDEPYTDKKVAYEYSLDYIFVNNAARTNGSIRIRYSAALFDLFAMLATDHCPVLIDFDLSD